MVITGAPNLSNETGVRGEVRSVREAERRVRNENEEEDMADLREEKEPELQGQNRRWGCMWALQSGDWLIQSWAKRCSDSNPWTRHHFSPHHLLQSTWDVVFLDWACVWIAVRGRLRVYSFPLPFNGVCSAWKWKVSPRANPVCQRGLHNIDVFQIPAHIDTQTQTERWLSNYNKPIRC